MFSRIIVPVDAFAEDPRLVPERVSETLRELIGDTSAIVEAVYVMTPKGTHVPAKEFPEWQEFYKNAATNILVQSLQNLSEKAEVRTHVLPRGHRTLRETVKTLLEYAQRENAELVALTTHARKGVDRFFLGSFAEACLLKSEIPLLVINPKTKWQTLFHRIIYPTDLNETNQDTLDRVAWLGRQLKAKVLLYHLEQSPFAFLPPPGFVAERAVEKQNLADKERLGELRTKLESQGVEVQIKQGLGATNAALAICEAAKEFGASLIVMETRSTKIGPISFGGTSRQVVRYAECPVLVFPVRGFSEEA